MTKTFYGIHLRANFISISLICKYSFIRTTTSCRRVKMPPIVHYGDVIISATAPQITSLVIVYSTLYSGADQRKHQSSASLAFVWGIHRWPVNSPHKGSVTRQMFPFDDVIVIFSRISGSVCLMNTCVSLRGICWLWWSPAAYFTKYLASRNDITNVDWPFMISNGTISSYNFRNIDMFHLKRCRLWWHRHRASEKVQGCQVPFVIFSVKEIVDFA